jgi:hypothetical protein
MSDSPNSHAFIMMYGGAGHLSSIRPPAWTSKAMNTLEPRKEGHLINAARTEANKGTPREAISCQIMHAALRHDESFT